MAARLIAGIPASQPAGAEGYQGSLPFSCVWRAGYQPRWQCTTQTARRLPYAGRAQTKPSPKGGGAGSQALRVGNDASACGRGCMRKLLLVGLLVGCNALGPVSEQRMTGRYQLSALEVVDPVTHQRWTLRDTLPGSTVTLTFDGLHYASKGRVVVPGVTVNLNATGTYQFETRTTLRLSGLLPEVYWVLTWAQGRNVLTATLYDPRSQEWTLWVTFRQG